MVLNVKHVTLLYDAVNILHSLRLDKDYFKTKGARMIKIFYSRDMQAFLTQLAGGIAHSQKPNGQ